MWKNWLKKPDTNCDNIRYINTNGILAVTGDYNNWIFCREYRPSADGYVSDDYWISKLKNSSCQNCMEMDMEATVQEIKRLLKEEEDLTERETDYLNECLSQTGNSNEEYKYYAYMENVGRFCDSEYVPYIEKPNLQLMYVFDGFEEICRRIKEQQ